MSNMNWDEHSVPSHGTSQKKWIFFRGVFTCLICLPLSLSILRDPKRKGSKGNTIFRPLKKDLIQKQQRPGAARARKGHLNSSPVCWQNQGKGHFRCYSARSWATHLRVTAICSPRGLCVCGWARETEMENVLVYRFSLPMLTKTPF